MSAHTIAIVGGGAAGMMAAATIAEARPGMGARVLVLERNPRLGAKVVISGGGRCNLTTGLTDVGAVLRRYPRGGRWLRAAMHAFPPAAVMRWFTDHGVPVKTEADGRVFPVSDRGRDVVAAFARVFERHGVRVQTRCRVTAIDRDPAGGFRLAAGGIEYYADAVILTTGGAAYTHTGSAGDGFRFAAALGHPVTPLYPSLNAYVVREPWAHALSGVALADAELRLLPRAAGGAGYRFRGPFIFTHTGVSGPAVFALCSLAATEPYDAAHPLHLRVNLLPELAEPALDALLRERLAALGGRGVANVLDTLLPRSLCAPLCHLAGVDPATKAAELSKAARRRLVEAIRALPLTIIGRRNGEEFVTAGGVDTATVDPATMASRLVPGLYLAGEVLNVDGFTGGFNLQAAWATGRAAGLAAAAAAAVGE